MSTKRSNDRCRTAAASLSCVLLALAGCSSFSGSRDAGLASTEKMKTTLAVGDKPMPVVSGEPGDSLQASKPSSIVSPRFAAKWDRRISGRVYDENGDPVDGASVRLAVNGVPGGRVSRVVTDPSGGFTLRNLRPGSSYTVIAEWDGEGGPLIGRADAQTSESGIRITLAPRDSKSTDESRPPTVSRVSDESDVEPTEKAPDRRRPIVNEEDLPPAVEAEEIETDDSSTQGSQEEKRWESKGTKSLKQQTPETVDSGSLPEPADSALLPAAVEEDGPNPLPPAIDPSSSASHDPPSEIESLSDRSTKLTDADTTAPRSRRQHDDPDNLPGALVVVPKTFAPIVIDDSADQKPEEQAETTRPPERTAGKDRHDTTQKSPKARSRNTTKVRSTTKQRPTWGDVTSSAGTLPPLEGASKTATEPTSEIAAAEPEPADSEPEADDDTVPDWAKSSEVGAEPVAHTASARSPDDSPGSGLSAGPNPADGQTPLCDYDDRHRKINDFRLPDLQGRPVSFQGLDADLVLLDFWGTWCQPCLKSIPKLVDLQAKYPGKKLTVVGIACEQGEFDEAASKVAATAERLKINYPVLLSRNDGNCPLQAALHIQAFPTLVLVDRAGRVIWRDQGSTPATLMRLERLLEENSIAAR